MRRQIAQRARSGLQGFASDDLQRSPRGSVTRPELVEVQIDRGLIIFLSQVNSRFQAETARPQSDRISETVPRKVPNLPEVPHRLVRLVGFPIAAQHESCPGRFPM